MSRSGPWNVISGIASVVAIAVVVLFFVLTQEGESKRLEVEVLTLTSFSSTDLDLGAVDVAVSYAGRPIADYGRFQIRVSNTGGSPILSGDYDTQLSLHFENVVRTLAARELASDPPEIEAEPQLHDATSVYLPSILMNPGDWYTLEIEVEAVPASMPRFDIAGRVVDVKEITYKEEPLAFRRAVTATEAYPASRAGRSPLLLLGLAFAGVVAVLFVIHLAISLRPSTPMTEVINKNLTVLEGLIAAMAGILISIGWLLS